MGNEPVALILVQSVGQPMSEMVLVIARSWLLLITKATWQPWLIPGGFCPSPINPAACDLPKRALYQVLCREREARFLLNRCHHN